MTKPPRVFFLLHRAHAALIRAVDRRWRGEANLSMTQLGVLFLLDQKDGRSASELAEGLLLSKSSLSGLLDRMADKGFLRREAEEEDGRVVRLFLEPQARDLVARNRALVVDHNAALLAPFTEDEQQVIARFLNHVADHADDIINHDS